MALSSKKKVRRRFAVRRSSIHGRGVFALTHIAKGERIVEYTGERITSDEADELYGEEQADSPHTMLYLTEDGTVIDATRWGSSARWINHSCNPNCESTEENGRVYIDAIRSIRPGEELCYDYNLVLDERHTPKAKREHACCCGAKNCRGTLLGPKR
jgi:SET domain-containing protein